MADDDKGSGKALWVKILLGGGGLGALIALIPVFMSNKAPVANLELRPEQGEAPLSVFANASGSRDEDDGPLRYAWFVNERRQQETGSSMRLVLPTPGEHVVRVEVSDGRASDDAARSVLVNKGTELKQGSRCEKGPTEVSKSERIRIPKIGSNVLGAPDDPPCKSKFANCVDLGVLIPALAEICNIKYFVTEADGTGWQEVQPRARPWFRIYPAKINEAAEGKHISATYKNWRRSHDRYGQIAVTWAKGNAVSP